MQICLGRGRTWVGDDNTSVPFERWKVCVASAGIGMVGSGSSSRVVKGSTVVEVLESGGEELWAARDRGRIEIGEGESRVQD